MRRLPILGLLLGAALVAGCSDDGDPFEPGPVGDDVVIKVSGTVVSSSDLSPLADVNIWVDVETALGNDPRATDKTNAEGRFSMVFTEEDCSLATELAFRLFARKKGYGDAELTADGNGGLPVLKCVSREQEIAFQLSSQ